MALSLRDGQNELKIAAPYQVHLTAYQFISISAGSISLDSTFKDPDPPLFTPNITIYCFEK